MKPALLSFDEALAALLAQAAPIDGVETVDTMNALGRVLAAELRSTLDVPRTDNTQMDGYAVRAAELAQASPARPLRLPITQRIAAGQVGRALAPHSVARIFTGAPMPDGADAVVMQEAVTVDGEHAVFSAPAVAGDWIRRRGEDIGEGTVILKAGARLTPQACGLAASVGCAQLTVRRRLRVACFFTGDELAMPGEPLRDGAIYNSNRYVLRTLLQTFGCEISDLGIVPDSLAATREALRRAAAGNDLIITSGGVSVGEEDHVRPAVQAEGELTLWQIAIKPGKPLAYGRVRRAEDGSAGASAHFIGLPGNPVSSLITFLMLARPFLLRLQGVEQVAPLALPLRADFDWPRPDRRREFLRARVNPQGGLDLFVNQGSAVLTSTVWADGVVDNPAGQAITRGDTVRFVPFAALIGS